MPDTDVTVRGLETPAVAIRFDLAAARSSLESTVRVLGLEKTFRFIGALDFGIVGEKDSDKTNLTGPSFGSSRRLSIKGRRGSRVEKRNCAWRHF